jgi:hypothetical protein
MMKKILLLCLTTMLFSCATISDFTRKTMQIENGMTKNEVIDILGVPKDRQFHDAEEIWKYEITGLTVTKYYFVWFGYNGVSGLTSSYTDNAIPDRVHDNRPMPVERRR